MNTTLPTDTLVEAPRVLVDAAAPVVDALVELDSKEIVATVADTAATVAEPVRRNPRRAAGVVAVVLVGGLVIWGVRRRRTPDVGDVDLDRAA